LFSDYSDDKIYFFFFLTKKIYDMKRFGFVITVAVTVINLLVISTFLDGNLKAFSPGDPEEVDCDCSSIIQPPDGPDGGSMIMGFGGPGGWGCATDYGQKDCFYDPGPWGWPQWIPDDYMVCIDGTDNDICECHWEFDDCGTAIFD
jgi:hypothetical protein